jgi:hypothetical protein
MTSFQNAIRSNGGGGLRKLLVLHLDVNKTLVFRDPAAGYTTEVSPITQKISSIVPMTFPPPCGAGAGECRPVRVCLGPGDPPPCLEPSMDTLGT